MMLSHNDINSSIKIIDFGLATIHGPNDPPLTALAGSALTLAPEVIKRSYGKECDLWSVGVIYYFLLTSCMPFNAKTDEEIFAKIVEGKYSYPEWARWGLTEKAKDLVGRLLMVDPKRRLNAKQALSDFSTRKNSISPWPVARSNSRESALVPPSPNTSIPTTRSRQHLSPQPVLLRPTFVPPILDTTIPSKSGRSMTSNHKLRVQQLRRGGPDRHHRVAASSRK